MRRTESVALRASELPWEQLEETLRPALESLGLSLLYGPGGDGNVTMLDHGSEGTVVLLEDAGIARRAALALATRAGVTVKGYEVVGTAGTKRFRFRTEAFTATAAGELKAAEGRELDLEDADQNWGGGSLEDQGRVVMQEFGQLPGGPRQSKAFGYKKKPAAKASTPRVATLLASLQKAKSHQAVPQENGRVELRIELAAGGRQTSFCTAAEYEELEKLLAGKRR